MSHWIVDDLVDVYIGTQWCPGTVEAVISNGSYCVLLNDPDARQIMGMTRHFRGPALAAIGRSHRHASGTDKLGRKVFITEASNNFVGNERLRDQV
jgi:hypothetical protein